VIISHKYKFIFIKTAKTAGSTIETLLKPYIDQTQDISCGSVVWKHGHRIEPTVPSYNLPKDKRIDAHMSSKDVYDIFFDSVKPKDYFVFTVERNSYDKCVSHYYWHCKQKMIDKGRNIDTRNFEDYIQDIYDTRMDMPSCWHRYTIDDKIAVDKVYQYNNLECIFKHLNKMHGLDVDLDKLKTTKVKSSNRPNESIKKYYQKGRLSYRKSHPKKIVEWICKKEIKYFNYGIN
tara:strand:- start:356 stop:1054 length:699 start_codon:yes stop_codon:yes gene_type:complete